MIGRNRDSEGRRKRRGTFSRVAEESARAVDGSMFKSLFRNKKKIYPDDYVPPEGIADALVKAGLKEDVANEIANMCRTTIEERNMRGRIGKRFTLDDAAAVCLYTLELDKKKYEMSLYDLLNRALRAEKNVVNEIVKVRDVLNLVMAALRKLPVVRGRTLYRGIRSKVNVRQYKDGSTVVWPGFSSTSPDMNTTKAFLSKTGTGKSKNGRSVEDDSTKNIKRIEMTEMNERNEKEREEEEYSGGTLFIIEDGWGYNMQPYSQFPDEEEIGNSSCWW